MTDFGKLFMEAKSTSIEWNGKTIILSDKFPVSNGDILLISIEKTNSNRRQGLCVDITGSCELNGNLHKIGKGVQMLFWEDTAPKQFELKVITKNDFVWVNNIWESTSYLGTKSVDYGHNGAAMIVEEIENGRRYYCNDGFADEDFDEIIFTIQKVVP